MSRRSTWCATGCTGREGVYASAVFGASGREGSFCDWIWGELKNVRLPGIRVPRWQAIARLLFGGKLKLLVFEINQRKDKEIGGDHGAG